MSFPMENRPLQPFVKRLQTQSYCRSVFRIFVKSRKSLEKISQWTPGKIRKNNLVKLENLKKKIKSGINLSPIHHMPLQSVKFCTESDLIQVEVPSLQQLSERNKDEGQSKLRASAVSMSLCKNDLSKVKLRNYFKHLNQQAKNHSSFVGVSALLHKRQLKWQASNKESMESSRTYRNGFGSVIIKAVSKDSSSDPTTGRSIQYQFCKVYKNRPSISPWEGAEEDDINHHSKQVLSLEK